MSPLGQHFHDGWPFPRQRLDDAFRWSIKEICYFCAAAPCHGSESMRGQLYASQVATQGLCQSNLHASLSTSSCVDDFREICC